MTFQLDQKEPSITGGGEGERGGNCESENRKEESTWLDAELGLGLSRRIWEGVYCEM